nr:IclR family transcriptional regulator C-terminal domain-containing protein [Candidatus Protofrankia californiensis]
MSRPEDETASQHVGRTIRALELLAEAPQTQASLARLLQVHRRTVRRLLTRLTDLGYAEPAGSDEPGAYVASAKLIALGTLAARRLDVVQISPDHLALVRGSSVQCRVLAIRRGRDVTIPVIQATNGSTLPSWLSHGGKAAPLHATAVGKVFLLNDTVLLEQVLAHELPAYTTSTLTRRADLLLELSKARRTGYTVEVNEFHVGQYGAACPVIDHTGQVAAALGAITNDADTLEDLGTQVRRAADSLSRALGGSLGAVALCGSRTWLALPGY